MLNTFVKHICNSLFYGRADAHQEWRWPNLPGEGKEILALGNKNVPIEQKTFEWSFRYMRQSEGGDRQAQVLLNSNGTVEL